MSKSMCKHSDKKYLSNMPENPKFKCAKCGRVANKDKNLCKSEKNKS